MVELTDKVLKQQNELFELVKKLEKRVARLEQAAPTSVAHEHIESEEQVVVDSHTPVLAPDREHGDDSFEHKIGEFWLARAGALVFLIGVAFLVSYPFAGISSTLMSCIAYCLVGAILVLSVYWEKTYQHLSGLLYAGGLGLLYFVTLRLHFFNENQVLSDKTSGLIALILSLGAIFYLAGKRQSQFLSGLAVVLAIATCMISDTAHFAAALAVATTGAAVFLTVRNNWLPLFILSIILVYLNHLLWMMNNPLLGKPLQAISEPHSNLLYLFIYAAIFALPPLLRNKADYNQISEAAVSFMNGGGLFILVSLSALTFYKTHISSINLFLACFFITGAVASWIHHEGKYSSAIYACFGYLALSVAIFTKFASPAYFIWLAWQSLLVISTAIWFRSRLLIIVNSVIYLGILAAYLQLAQSNDFVNLSYALVALISARILNWKRERLELKTDMIRNAYLASVFIVVLYGLNQAVPGPYISLSWLGAALFYFGMSLLLSNTKYRWLAFLTIFAMMVRVFFFDLAQLDAALRIVIFLLVGFVLLSLSLYYARRKKHEAVIDAKS